MPALEAAHIRPYGDGGEHEARNGLLLRRDIHSLFDAGYVTVTHGLDFEVWMARKMTEWPSKRGPITKIMPSDGCIGRNNFCPG